MVHLRPELSVLRLQLLDLFIQRADMLDGAVEDLALAWLDSLTSLLGAVCASPGERWDSLAKLVEVRVQVLSISPLHGCVRDALALATAI